MCAHSSGAIGFPLRLLAREVYDRVVAIKGEAQVALITGEQRIEPPTARYFLCTVEAMPYRRPGGGGGPEGDFAFVALDEAQLAADRERGHIFTDRLLHFRGREETMLLGSATLEPLVKQLEPQAEMIERPRFSTLKHIGARKLSRLPPRSAIVAFSAEQVYGVAEMLRRFRGGSAVVMGALSPETRNRQVELFQSGEVDYIVATDAIGMGLNLDLNHVAFAGLTKFDGIRQRRLLPAEMAQIAGRAGRHQRDGTFGVLTGASGKGRSAASPPEFTEDEIFAIEEHRFAPLTRLFWREAEPRFDTVEMLIADLEASPENPALAAAPEALDLAVLKRLHEDGLTSSVRGSASIRRFWEACSLPDFRSQGTDMHARFVGRLWQDLREGYLGADYVAARISELDNVQGDIDTLQGRIAAIRSWAYICQRPDWVMARDEMAARARAAEAKLSDALHARLTERFVNRRTAILMKTVGQDAGLLPISLNDDGVVLVEDEEIGRIEGFRFVVDPAAGHEDHRMLVAAAEKALPRILAERATKLIDSEFAGASIEQGAIIWQGRKLALLELRDGQVRPDVVLGRDLSLLPDASRTRLTEALEAWLSKKLEPLAPLEKLQEATRDPQAGSQARALLHKLVAGHGFVSRENAGLDHLPKELRPFLRRLGVTFGALDIFVVSLLKPAPRRLLHDLGIDRRPLQADMLPVLKTIRKLPSGYRPAGDQAIRIDLAEKILRAAHDARGKTQSQKFAFDSALAISIGLEESSFRRLMQAGGFRISQGRALPEAAFGPPAPDRWGWRPSRRKPQGRKPARGKGKPKTVGEGNPFGALADLVR
ncbi:helicase [Altererythrobacter aurantiacus]|uniref:Helicase n=2 Tax=Parapontixanthobacter aurantiacus TaxID=1463599 RepID=A0A844ZMD7_9SPHN|nr:helicase-related protein [Parapontixanthobacter aurantiacus]MXO86819.1 helicase [Parapontixanthobacter aurantiacus]